MAWNTRCRTLERARSAPARMVQMNDAKVAKALRQIAPRHPGAAAIELGIDKQATVDCGRRPRRPALPGKRA